MTRRWWWIAAVVLWSCMPGVAWAADAGASGGNGVVRFGVLYGGSLLGFDREIRVTDRAGVQFGLGLVGCDAGVVLHTRPDPSAPYVLLEFSYTGFGDTTLGLVSADYGWHWKRLAAQIGLGVRTAAQGGFDTTPRLVVVTSLGIWGLAGS